MRIYAAMAAEWKRLYEEEELTIEQISLSYQVTTGTVHRWLKKTNTKMRDTGSKRGKPQNNVIRAGDSKPDGPMEARKTTAYLGHRRRRRY